MATEKRRAERGGKGWRGWLLSHGIAPLSGERAQCHTDRETRYSSPLNEEPVRREKSPRYTLFHKECVCLSAEVYESGGSENRTNNSTDRNSEGVN